MSRRQVEGYVWNGDIVEIERKHRMAKKMLRHLVDMLPQDGKARQYAGLALRQVNEADDHVERLKEVVDGLEGSIDYRFREVNKRLDSIEATLDALEVRDEPGDEG